MATHKDEVIDAERLVRLEEKQKAMTANIATIAKTLKDNTDMTAQIKQTLDELTGAKKFLIWLTSFVVGIGVIIATWFGYHHGK